MASITKKDSRVARTVSRETVIFLVLLFAIAMAGFNSGNNLLYLVTGVLVAGVVISLVAGRINLSRIEVERQLPPHIFAGDPCTMTIEVRNNKRFFATLGVTLTYGRDAEDSLFVLSIGKGGVETRSANLTLDRRGLYRLPPIVMNSRFPLGLFNLRRTIEDPREIIVFPSIRPISSAATGSSPAQDEYPNHVKGHGSGLYGIREYRHGEHAAGIHWKLSGKLDRLMVRETEREERRRVCIVLDTVVKDKSSESLEAFERAVSQAASLAWFFCQKDYSVKLVTHGTVIAYGEGSRRLHGILVALALVGISEDGQELSLSRRVFEGGAGILVTATGEITPIRSARDDSPIILTDPARARAS